MLRDYTNWQVIEMFKHRIISDRMLPIVIYSPVVVILSALLFSLIFYRRITLFVVSMGWFWFGYVFIIFLILMFQGE